MTQAVSVLAQYPDYEVNIGIEVHVQLTTNSKIFCACRNGISQEPNSNICEICCGYPGTLPVLNKQVAEYAVRAGLATNCTIAPISEFARKHYFYPDLPKGYQITQADKPICAEGYLEIPGDEGHPKRIRLIRIHIEEDAGKSLHAGSGGESFVDLNRAGTPLLEIVSYPDISSAAEARHYLKGLRAIVQYLGICSGNMEEGAFRADTNISVRKKGAVDLGTKCELKNINSFKFISDAIEYEIERQIDLIESGGRVRQETRLWDTKSRETTVMRSKEEAADYRYLPDPDLPLLEISPAFVDLVSSQLPELPNQKMERFIHKHGLTVAEAEILCEDKELADFYDAAYKKNQSKGLVNWILRDLMGMLKDKKIALHECKITPERLAALVELVDAGVINNRAAQEVFAAMIDSNEEPRLIVKQRGLEQIGSAQELESVVVGIISQYPEQVAAYRGGKDKLWGFFLGEAMKQTKGKGDPKLLNELLKKNL